MYIDRLKKHFISVEKFLKHLRTQFQGSFGIQFLEFSKNSLDRAKIILVEIHDVETNTLLQFHV